MTTTENSKTAFCGDASSMYRLNNIDLVEE